MLALTLCLASAGAYLHPMQMHPGAPSSAITQRARVLMAEDPTTEELPTAEVAAPAPAPAAPAKFDLKGKAKDESKKGAGLYAPDPRPKPA